MNEQLVGKKIAILVESQYIPQELKDYREYFESRGAEAHFITRLWEQDKAVLVCEVEAQGHVPETFEVNIDLDRFLLSEDERSKLRIEDYSAAVGEPMFDGINRLFFRSERPLQQALSSCDGLLSKLRDSTYVSDTGCTVLSVQSEFRSGKSGAAQAGDTLSKIPSGSSWADRPRTGVMAITEQLRGAGLIGCGDQVDIGNPGSGEELINLEPDDEIRLGFSEAFVGHIQDSASRLNRKPAVAVARGYVGFSGLQGGVWHACCSS